MSAHTEPDAVLRFEGGNPVEAMAIAADKALLALRLECTRLRKALGVVRSHLAGLHAEWSPLPDSSLSVHALANRLAWDGDYIANTLAAPPPALEELQELVAAAREWRNLPADVDDAAAVVVTQRLLLAVEPVLAAYPWLGSEVAI